MDCINLNAINSSQHTRRVTKLALQRDASRKRGMTDVKDATTNFAAKMKSRADPASIAISRSIADMMTKSESGMR